MLLPDHIVIKNRADFLRRGNAITRLHQRGFVFLANDVHAEFNTFVADKDGRPSNQLPDLMLAFAAEGTVERVLGVAAAHLTHKNSLVTHGPFSCSSGSMHQNRACLEEPDQGTPSFIHKWGSANADPDLLIQYPYEHVIRRGINISLPPIPYPRLCRGVYPALTRAESQRTGPGKPR